MSMATAPLVGSTPASPETARWSGLLEFLLVGGATLVLLPLAWLYQDLVGVDTSEYTVSFVAFYAAYIINDPHFAVTYVLFYRDAKNRAFGDVFGPMQRLRYIVAGALVPVVLLGWGIYALASATPQTLGLMMQLMFFLVGWHYVKQGFGVLSVLSLRRGVGFTRLERWVILAHCFLAWAYAWSTPADMGSQYEESGVVYTSIAHPPGLETVTEVLFFASAAALLYVLFFKWRREGRLPPPAPLGGLLITVWMWTVYSDLDPLLSYVIPALHSIQYLYFVWLLKRGETRQLVGEFGSAGRRLLLFGATTLVLAFFIFHGVPETLDENFVMKDELAPLGPTPYLAAIVTAVNIHHYFMDFVIWRRENPDTRFLRA